MRLTFLGTCSGTEPMPGRHHTSFIVEHHDRLFFFDAGENCAHMAHTMGFNLQTIRAIFISHTHIDHVGGLGNLLWTVRKLERRRGYPASPAPNIDLFLPDARYWPALAQLMALTEGGFEHDFTLNERLIADGPLFDEEGLKVTALHNNHLKHEDGAPWRSFGFAIEADGRKVVYTGDTKGYDDFAPLMDGCDLLLHETGHHDPVAVAARIAALANPPHTLAFLHHGRAILNDPAGQAALLDQIEGLECRILNDGDIIEV